MSYALSLSLKIYFFISAVAFLLYSPRIIFYFYAFTKQKRLSNARKNKIAVIIPARNESAVIADCLNTLKAQTYDKDYFDTVIIIVDENDPTVEIAANYSNTSVILVKEQTSKGEALDGAIKKILKETPDKYQAFLIIDADNLCAPDTLQEYNNALASNRQIICGRKMIKNWQSSRRDSRSAASNCTALTYIQLDDMGNKARTKKNIPINMIGTGMMVRADVIEELGGWPYRSLTEDFEMTADSLIKGWTSMYYEHAIVYTEEAVKFKMAFKRRLRWIKGYVQVDRKYRKPILKKTFSKNGIKFKNFDFLFSTYPMYGFIGISAVMTLFGAVSFIVLAAGVNFAWQLALAVMLVPLASLYVSFFLFTFLTLLAGRKIIKIPFYEKVFLLFFNPLYLFTYFKIFIMAFFTPKDYFKWQSTDRIPFENKRN